jgi:hypothetical protein
MIVERQEKESWGKAVVERLAADLQKEFPGIQGYSARNIWYMRMFYITYHENTKLQPMVAEISWDRVRVGQSSKYPDKQFVQQLAAQIP